MRGFLHFSTFKSTSVIYLKKEFMSFSPIIKKKKDFYDAVNNSYQRKLQFLYA